MADEKDSNENNEEKQKELVDLIKGIPADGKRLEAMGRQAIEAGRLSQDVRRGWLKSMEQYRRIVCLSQNGTPKLTTGRGSSIA